MSTVNLDIVTPNGSVYEKDDVELVVFKLRLVKWVS